MRTVPDKDTRSQLIATGLRDMFRKGTRTEAENNINGFVKFYADLKRNGTDKLLKSELPAQTVRRWRISTLWPERYISQPVLPCYR